MVSKRNLDGGVLLPESQNHLQDFYFERTTCDKGRCIRHERRRIFPQPHHSRGTKKETATTLVSGQVRSNKGPVQGAKVLLRKAPIVEHQLSVAGTLQDSRIPGSETNHLRFVIDNEDRKQLIMHRGEIHRFYLDPSSEGNPLAFFDRRTMSLPK